MKRLRFFLMMCVICAGMGSAQDVTSQVEVKFRYNHFLTSDSYLTETSENGYVHFKIDRGNPTTFGLEPVGAGRYLISMGTKYLFANVKKEWSILYYGSEDSFGFDEDNSYFDEEIGLRSAGLTLLAVNAVCQDGALYVLGDEQVTDYSELDGLAQSGRVKKINLSQTNNFAFSFLKHITIEGATAYLIIPDSEMGIGIDDFNKNVRIVPSYDAQMVPNSFFIESESVFDPEDADHDGQFGENNALHWELKDGMLTISGTGDMPDSPVPWYTYINSITNILITEGITTVRWKSSHTNLVSVTLPQSLVSTGAGAFSGLPKLTSVTVNWTAAEDLPAMGDGVFRNISPNAVLHVPSGTKAIYEAAAQWKEFKTIKEQGVTAQPTPIRHSQGDFNVSLAVPETGTFTATFDVVLPAKFRLNNVATKLAESLTSRFDLTVTEKGNGVWSLGITPKTIRSASANPFRDVVRVVYNVENTLEDGVYELKVKALELKLADGTEIREDEIVIPVTFNSATGNETPPLSEMAIRSFGRNLYVTTPVAACLSVFTPEGSLQKQLFIPAGETAIALPAGIYVVKAGDTVKKISIF
ncbi:MAG: leucine-rich repeat domain-containing protein [Dysgonamonadaceae bacterium]|jgi:hypothetical protein|nr:leucine-rich repeat domain-containing protein [Dysgonamonadaceae bacterium]